jgi:hypothetical protein
MTKKIKAQESMLAIVLIMIIFIVLGLFLFVSSLGGPPELEYNNLYAHNLLISTLRTTTGYPSPCKTISDTLVCAYSTPLVNCAGVECKVLAEGLTNETISKVLKPNLKYYLIVKSEIGGGSSVFVGDSSVINTNPHWTANERVITHDLRIELILANK